jgi:hypothetical protein
VSCTSQTGADTERYSLRMAASKHPVEIVVWQDGEYWLGHFVEFPGCTTQGNSKADLYEHLADLWQDLAVNPIPGVRRLETLAV